MKNYRIIKGKKIHVNQLAAWSRKFTVSNTTKSISPVVNHPRTSAVYTNPIVNPLTGNKFDQVNPHQITGKYGVTITAYDWVKPEGQLWEHKRYKQPMRLIKHKARKYSNWKSYAPQDESIKKIKREKRNDFIKFFPNYPYTIKPLNKTEYMEKLVEHKTAKWERKNPKPADMFVEEVEKWNQLRATAIERFRDFVVSIYDPLLLTGRFVVNKTQQVYDEEKVAEIKDINGEGHKVNELPKTAKLIKKAQKVTNDVKAKRPNLVATNLRDHKKQKGRIILPEAA